MSTEALLICLARVLFLNFRRIGEHQRAEVLGAWRAEHAPPKASSDQSRQVTAVIEVCVRQDQRVNGRRRNRERLPVAIAQFLESLEQAAIDEDSMGAEVEQVL